jgi:hypothetical protein
MNPEKERSDHPNENKTEQDVYNLIHTSVQIIRKHAQQGRLDFEGANQLVPNLSLAMAGTMGLSEGPGLAFSTAFDRSLFILLLEDEEGRAKLEHDKDQLTRVKKIKTLHQLNGSEHLQHIRQIALQESEHSTDFTRQDIQTFLERLNGVGEMTAFEFYVSDTPPSAEKIQQDTIELRTLGMRVAEYVSYMDARAREFYAPLRKK